MWNPNLMAGNSQEEDIRNGMVSIWPPRSYTCTFCKREFRSAQALGGHMNVHRRDRARLHHAQPNTNISSSTLLVPSQELVGNGGLCLLYSLPKPGHEIFKSSCLDKVVTPRSFNSSLSNSSNTGASTSTNCESNDKVSVTKKRKKNDRIVEVIDLELRLGCSSSAS